MSDVGALAVGTLLAVGALAFVLYPLFFETRATRTTPRGAADTEDSAIVALREIEFDRATGKLSESDYSELRRTYAQRALAEMRAQQGSASQSSDAAPIGAADPVEALVSAYRRAHVDCPTCGLRPEPDAVYCSNCGKYLPGTCPHCSAPIVEAAATFCSTCCAPVPRHARVAV